MGGSKRKQGSKRVHCSKKLKFKGNQFTKNSTSTPAVSSASETTPVVRRSASARKLNIDDSEIQLDPDSQLDFNFIINFIINELVPACEI